MMQNTEYFGLYRNSNIRCDVTPTSRITYIDLAGERGDRGVLYTGKMEGLSGRGVLFTGKLYGTPN